MTRFILLGIAAGMALCALTLSSLAHGVADIPRPKPRPLMDCWKVIETGETECEVRK